MTPNARYAAAIEILDGYLSGAPLEKTLTNWARRSRFAGSGDRAAIRDIVFDCVRARLSCAALGGAETGRGLVLGHLRMLGREIDPVFCGEGFAPAVVTPGEAQHLSRAPKLEPHVALDCPDWLYPDLSADLGADVTPVLELMKTRADTHLRVNLSRCSRADAAAALEQEDIGSEPHSLCETALSVTRNPRKITQSAAFRAGMVELQDAASQAVCAALPDAVKVLDYCAGGGGKALAYADRNLAEVFVHDANPSRMRDIESRAKRAGQILRQADGDGVARNAPYDLILCDVPCSGSGAWRRSPDGKWSLTPARLEQLCQIQAEIVQKASLYLAPHGVLAYVTCSLLNVENSAQKRLFLQDKPEWHCSAEQQFTPLDGADGLYMAHLTQNGDKLS